MVRVTIGVLAERLGISTASVSYALNGQPGVSDETRKRVIDLAAELGWRRSSRAVALRLSRSNTIGIILRRGAGLLGSEPFYMRVLESFEEVLTPHENGLLLRIARSPDEDLEIYRSWAAEQRVDGVILFDLLQEDPRPALLRSLGLPFVIQGVLHGDSPETATFESQAADARLIVEHLVQLGHREIAHVTGPFEIAHEVHRNENVISAAEEHGVRVRTLTSDYTLSGAAGHLDAALRSGAGATAVIASNDLMALGCQRVLRQHGLETTTALVSWDDSMLCILPTPSISALERHIGEAGRRSARALLALIDKGTIPPDDDLPVPSTLVVRETSVRAAPSA